MADSFTRVLRHRFFSGESSDRVFAGLFLAILSLSWAAILVRYSGAVPALIIAFYRMFWSSLLLGGMFVLGGYRAADYRRLSHSQLWLAVAAGVFLALHFASWIAAVQHTSVAQALVLSSVHPVFALLLSPWILRERGGSLAYVAAFITMAGVVLIGLGGEGGEGQLKGDMLAITAALCVTFYLLFARLMRGQIDLTPYLFLVYSTAALVLLLASLAAGFPLTNWSRGSHLAMLMLALIPTGIGHSLLNWAARKMPAYKVNQAVLGETVVASVLAFFLFGELPQSSFYPGAAIILAGILLAMRQERK